MSKHRGVPEELAKFNEDKDQRIEAERQEAGRVEAEMKQKAKDAPKPKYVSPNTLKS
jgi:hypothetical protein